jgi:hypothetical protein
MTEKNIEVKVEDNKSQSATFTQTVEEVKEGLAAAKKEESAKDLDVDQASYDKYYKNGKMDWASFGKEQAFKQKNTKKEESTEDTKAEEIETLNNVEKVIEDAGLNFDDMSDSIVKSGNIEDKDRKSLIDSGIPGDIIDTYIKLLHKETADHIGQIEKALGGKENFTQVFEALQEKATQKQRDTIDGLMFEAKTFNAGINLALELAGLSAPESAKEEKTSINTLNKTAPSSSGVKGFNSMEEQTLAMRDPKYKKDAAYRKEVEKRVGASTYNTNVRLHSSGL